MNASASAERPQAAAQSQPILEAKGISKAFGHVQALDNVDFELYSSEVVALIGDNGAGKSTLVKILSGIYRKDAGQIYMDGKPVEIHGPKDAERIAGISTVYQDLALVDVRDVGSNIYLHIEPNWLGLFINFKKMYADAQRVVSTLRIDMPSVRVNVGDLSGGQRQGVAIPRALARGRRIFILDEPTAALGVEQQHKVNELIANLKAEGKTVMVISHNLEHVFTVADRLVVLRHGQHVGTRLKTETTREEIVGLITAAIKGDVRGVKRMKFGKLEINPVLSPGVLDTATWDRAGAWSAFQAVTDSEWRVILEAVAQGLQLPTVTGLTIYSSSCARHGETLTCLACLADGQQVFLALGPQATDVGLGSYIGSKAFSAASMASQSVLLALYPTDASVIDRFFRTLAPDKGPRALGTVPRLGIGTRMTTVVWPAIWAAMTRRGFAANAIQNSVRELNFLETLLEARPAENNIAFGFGAIETGYTGSSFEGLWVAGVLDALRHGVQLPYGADADHIQVKRGSDGMARARRMLDATRYYSFYTLDVSDVLDYSTMTAAGAAPLEARLPDHMHRRELVTFHQQPRRVGSFDYRPDEATLSQLVGKYWTALDAVVAMHEHIAHLKDGWPFDLELSIDEHPNEVPTFDCLTSETELIFVLLEAQRRGIPLTHVAPNFGVEKGTDYRGADGLAGFEARACTLCRIAEEFGIMADFHSGDDLTAARQAIGRATGGRNHFKVSPNLQLLFAQVLSDHHPDLFRRWWQDALAYAQREAAGGSAFARDCIRQSDIGKPSSHDAIFHNFSFAFVGRRDAAGQFICREEFYSLSPAFYQAYQECIAGYLLELADDLFRKVESDSE